MEAHHVEQQALGVYIGMLAAWTMDEVGIAAKVRLNEVVRAMKRLKKAGLALLRTLWPGAVHPSSMSRLPRWLDLGPVANALPCGPVTFHLLLYGTSMFQSR
ncbi:hypothetical protein ZWY2020_049822 [Hordeum vulgare]|nr:hypothetical protein ZWY2020_049822 [Hordeum vulgare]